MQLGKKQTLANARQQVHNIAADLIAAGHGAAVVAVLTEARGLESALAWLMARRAALIALCGEHEMAVDPANACPPWNPSCLPPGGGGG